MDAEAAASILNEVYAQAEGTSLSARTYVELVLVIGDLGGGELNAERLYSDLSTRSKNDLKGSGGVSRVSSTSSMSVNRTSTGTTYEAPRMVEVVDALGDLERVEVVEAVVEHGRVFPERARKELVRFLERALDSATRTHSTHDRQSTEPPQTQNTDRQSTGDRPNDPNLRVSDSHLKEQGISAPSDAEGGKTGVETEKTSSPLRGNCSPLRGISGGFSLSEAQIRALLDRNPSGDVPRIAVPDQLYEDVIEWRPVLQDANPLMAIAQLILFSQRRDESYIRSGRYRKLLTGIPLHHELVFKAFGLTPQVGWNEGLSAEKLLKVYQALVDKEFGWTSWSSEEGRARLVDSHNIPNEIINTAREAKMNQDKFDSFTWLMSGKSADHGDHIGIVKEERVAAIGEQEPAIEPPPHVRDIQEYMNTLNRAKVFSHSQYGVFKEDALDRASEVAARTIKDPERRNQAFNKLYFIRRYPKPVYLVCDRFPRLKADRHNQAMNLPSEILRPIYTKRDYEVDLSKAHLACMVPLAEQEGIDASTLREWVEWSMEEGNDLWTGVASCFSDEYDWDPEAARPTAKKLYALVYGSTTGNLFFEMSQAYAGPGREYRSHDAFEPVLNHELVEEILQIRSELRSVIEKRGGMEDAAGRFIPLEKWDDTKAEEDRWRGVMAYVNASYEQKLMHKVFELAREERERDARARFKVWLYQADGVTVRMSSKASHSRQIERLQNAVAEEAERLGIPTKLEVDYSG